MEQGRALDHAELGADVVEERGSSPGIVISDEGRNLVEIGFNEGREFQSNHFAGPEAAAATAPPAPLTAEHDASQFVCRHDTLSAGLRKRALPSSPKSPEANWSIGTPAPRTLSGHSPLTHGSRFALIALSMGQRLRSDP